LARVRRSGAARTVGSVVSATNPAIMQEHAQRLEIYLVHRIPSWIDCFGLILIVLQGLVVGRSGKVARGLMWLAD
jgi:hypothetical protein